MGKPQLKKCPKCGGGMKMVIDAAQMMMGLNSSSLGTLKCSMCGHTEGLDANGIMQEVLAAGRRRKKWWQFWKK